MPSLELIHHPQKYKADCLSACASMALANLNIRIRYWRLRRILKAGNDGTAFRNLRFLESLKTPVSVSFDFGHMGVLESFLSQGIPVIASVVTIDLPYWNGESTDHAVVVAGIDDMTVSLYDPWFDDAPKIVEYGQFDSAWLRSEYLYAVIQRVSND